MRQRNRQKKKGAGQDSGEMQSSKGVSPFIRRDLCKSCVNPLLNPGSWQLSCKGSWQLSKGETDQVKASHRSGGQRMLKTAEKSYHWKCSYSGGDYRKVSTTAWRKGWTLQCSSCVDPTTHMPKTFPFPTPNWHRQNHLHLPLWSISTGHIISVALIMWE